MEYGGKPLSEQRWEWDFFLAERKKVLDQWRTGSGLQGDQGLLAGLEYHADQPWYKYASLRNERALEEGRIQIVPQVGHALVEQNIHHMELSEDLHPDRWYVLTDSYTRKGQFAKAEDAIRRSTENFSFLNGYPVVAHSVDGARHLNECTKAACGSDNNDEDARLAWEILLAGGFTWGTIKSLEQVIQHSRDYPIEAMIFNHQYMDRLSAYYTEHGVPILRRASANLPGWDTLGFKVTTALVELLLAARQGLKYVDLSIGIGMNLVQDVAAIRVLNTLAREYLDDSGYRDVRTYPWTYMYLGEWPLERGQMSGQLAWNCTISALAGCNGVIIKSPDESTTTPTGEGFREAMHIAGQITRLVAGQRLPMSDELSIEEQMIEAEVRSVMSALHELGEGDLALGVCEGTKSGVLDTMFSPWRHLRGEVQIVRDARGALRYLNPGQVPIPSDVLEYHKSRIAEQERKSHAKADLSWVISTSNWASRSLTEETSERSYWNDES